MSKIYQIFYRKSSEDSRDLTERYSAYSDEQILEILKQRTYYTPEAAQLAVEEALKRGLIQSEQDLMSEAFRVEALKFSWFPKPLNKENGIKIKRSIGRSLVFCGIFPVVFGLVEMNTGNQIEGSLILLFGMLWILLSSQLLKVFRPFLFGALVFANLMAAAYIYFNLLSMPIQVFMDYFISTVLFLLINYGLVYVYKINRHELA